MSEKTVVRWKIRSVQQWIAGCAHVKMMRMTHPDYEKREAKMRMEMRYHRGPKEGLGKLAKNIAVKIREKLLRGRKHSTVRRCDLFKI